MDYRNVCYFLIFVLCFFCYDLYEKNVKLKNICENQDLVIKDLQKALIFSTGGYYYIKPKKEDSPMH
tara:strand:- start:1114 stop:1314 length:201 start_codon:yes stop_codon:yes gene_type:complete